MGRATWSGPFCEKFLAAPGIDVLSAESCALCWAPGAHGSVTDLSTATP